MDLGHPFLTEQLIAYIGNKRALLPFLHGVLSGLVEEPSRCAFLDPFAGSGAVSRLARMMGFRVHANDWETYSFVLNSCHLGLGQSELRGLFRKAGGLSRLLAEMNHFTAAPAEEYISRHYAPRSTATADWRTERLFYTRENALAIDALRERIEGLYPGEPAEPDPRAEKHALLATLLYEAATHTNTSGVFKACHKGFGGHGRDALNRILAPIRLRAPVLVDSPAVSTMTCVDAASFLRARSGEVCYLDPPYAQHQYGSNYFMLNTIALWDKPPVNDKRGADGRFLEKAGIRSDWTRTRSAFCYRRTALPAMKEVVDAADCRWLVVSYSNEGVIGLEELCDLLSVTGGLTVHSTGYVRYPGGKQSLVRTIRNLELALVVDRRAGRAAAGAAATDLPAAAPLSAADAVPQVRLAQLLSGSFDPDRVRASFATDGDAILVPRSRDRKLPLRMRYFWRFARDAWEAGLPQGVEAQELLSLLSGCALRDVQEEIEVVVRIARAVTDEREQAGILREAARLLNRLAHKKNHAVFLQALATLRGCRAPVGFEARYQASLDAVEERARRRSEGTRRGPA
jgi:adenine-specific DNA-methyltransferase